MNLPAYALNFLCGFVNTGSVPKNGAPKLNSNWMETNQKANFKITKLSYMQKSLVKTSQNRQ